MTAATASERPATYRHTDLGTDEPTWLLDARWDDVPALDPAAALADIDTVVVLAAHPDDESLGAGGLIAAAARAGVPVHVVVATAGEGSHPEATAWTAEQLGEVRRLEARAAVTQLSASHPGELQLLGLPDGGVAGHEDAVIAAATPLLTERTLLLAPWAQDGHPDHDAVGRAATRLTTEADGSVRCWQYPIWRWHWSSPDDLPWQHLRQVPLDADLLAAKRAAVAAHASQTTPLGPAEGDRPILLPHVQARFERVVECYVTDEQPPNATTKGEDARAATFDELLGEGDPWGWQSWYERRKRDLTLASLQREHYARVLDIGCATGELSAALAERADLLVGTDVSGAALERARARGLPHATWVHGAAPGVLAELTPPFDLVVISELGYFLTGTEWLATLRRARALLADGGELLLCHWRHPTSDLALDGTLVDAQARAMLDLPVRVTVADHDVLLTVFGGTPPQPGASR